MHPNKLYHKLIDTAILINFRWKRFLAKRQRRIDFIGIGTAKAGTSALYGYLSQHPDIGMGHPKEVHYFDEPKHFFFPKWFYIRYHRHFKFNERKKIYGEITPMYIFWDDAPRHIWDYNPHIKLIAILRNPIDRAFSHWNMNEAKNIAQRSFEEVLTREFVYNPNRPPVLEKGFIIERGFYSIQIKRYRRYFKNEQLLFIKYDDFKKQPEQTLTHIFNFLGVEPSKFNFKPLVANAFNYQSTMSPETRNQLRNIYRNEIHEVERLLNWDCSDWLA